LILSEFAGACQSLCGAIRINPWNVDQIVQALHQAVTMSPEERITKHEYNIRYVSTHTALTWANTLLNSLLHSDFDHDVIGSIPERLDFQTLKDQYKAAKHRIFLIDYDGTLSPIVSKPNLATPSDTLIKLLKKLASDEKNIIYVISGRDRQSLDDFLGTLPIGLSAEHGCFIRRPPFSRSNGEKHAEWECIVASWDNTWKDTIYSIFKDFQERTPGSMIERKQINITWHYRNADPDYGSWMSKELLAHLRDSVAAKLPIEVLVGKKAIEVRPKGINKAAAVKKILNIHENIPFDFIFCIGDDKTDEDMFLGLQELSRERTLTSHIFTITVGKKRTEAKYYLETQPQVLQLLSFLCDYNTTIEASTQSTNNLIIAPNIKYTRN
jgi:trehalose-phosphatase